MKARWKNKAAFKPQVILDKIDNAKKISEEGKVVSFSAFDYHDAFAALFSMIEFPKVVKDELSIDSIVRKAIKEIATSEKITKDKFIEKINDIIKLDLATRENNYHFLTSLSICGDLPFESIEFERTLIQFMDDYPEKYSCRNEVINKVNIKLSCEHKGYKKVILTTKSKSTHGASSKSFKSFDIVRAVLCIFANSGMELFGDTYAPINRIRVGEVHTLHNDDGLVATDGTVWFEPNFIIAKPFQARQPDVYNKNVMWFIDKLLLCKYQDTLKDGLLRFVRALDERNHNSALIQIWGALESIAAPNESCYDAVTKRCSFIFEEQKYHEQILEHLREFRNQSIHAGDQSENTKTLCFQLQFYFRELMFFHLRNVSEFDSLDQANSFLDLPTNKEALIAKRKLLNKAIEFLNINDQ